MNVYDAKRICSQYVKETTDRVHGPMPELMGLVTPMWHIRILPRVDTKELTVNLPDLVYAEALRTLLVTDTTPVRAMLNEWYDLDHVEIWEVIPRRVI